MKHDTMRQDEAGSLFNSTTALKDIAHGKS